MWPIKRLWIAIGVLLCTGILLIATNSLFHRGTDPQEPKRDDSTYRQISSKQQLPQKLVPTASPEVSNIPSSAGDHPTSSHFENPNNTGSIRFDQSKSAHEMVEIESRANSGAISKSKVADGKKRKTLREGNLYGVVLGEDEFPCVSAQISIVQPSTGYQDSAVTNQSGEFFISGIPPGLNFLVSALEDQYYAPSTIHDLTIEPDQTTDVLIVLKPIARVSAAGQMIDAHGKPISDTEFRLSSVSNLLISETVQTDKEGYFTSDNIPEGKLFLQLVENDLISAQHLQFSSVGDVPQEVKLGLGELNLTIELSANVENADPTQVFLRWSEHNENYISMSLFTSSMLQGEAFTWEGLPPGTYSIRISNGSESQEFQKVLNGDDIWIF
jgi:hypothetical protein